MKNKIYYIYASDCKKCERFKKIIKSYLAKNNISNSLIELDSESDDALNLAIKYQVDDIPALIVVNDNEHVTSYNKELEKIIKKIKNNEYTFG